MPASFCGISGLKTTYGRVSRYGLIPLVSSFDTIGPMARSVYDVALILETIAGHDAKDSTSRVEPVPNYSTGLRKSNDLHGLRIGIPQEYFVEGLDSGVATSVDAAIKAIQHLGAEVLEVSLPHTQYAIPVYYLIQDFEKAFETCDALITPVSPTTAFRIGEKITNPLDMYLSDVFVVAVNLAGIPALSVPCGISNGLPVGMHIIGTHLSEETLLRIGHMYQSQTDWRLRRPPCWNY